MTAPDAPTVDSVTNTLDENGVPDGTTVSGTAEPNSAVEIRDPDTGDVVGTGNTDENGNYEITTDEPLEDGKDYDVVAIDDAGNVSEPATATGDITAPDAPTVDSVTNTLDENGVPDGTTVSGTAEPNSSVEIRDPDTGDVVGTGEADENGNYEITTDEPLEDGKDYDVVAIDDTGNVSEPATATGDITAPDAPTVDSVTNTLDENGVPDGTTVSGTAEPNSVVEIRDPDTGDVVGTGEADENGNYEITTDEPLDDGKDYDVVAIDDTGNVSEPATATGDITAPDAPTLTLVTDTGRSDGDANTYDGTIAVAGLEEGATWEYSSDGGETWNDGEGTGFVLPEAEYAEGDVIARQTDAAGNVSDNGALGAAIVDTTAPEIVIDTVVDGPESSTITGTTEPNSRVEITDAEGNSLGEPVFADENGEFTFVTDQPADLAGLSAGVVSDQNPEGSQTAPMITQLDNGDLLYVWGEGANLSTFGDGHLLRGRFYNADGTPKTDTFDISDIGYNKAAGTGYKSVDGLDVLKMDDGKVAIGWSINNADAADSIQSKMTVIDTNLAPTEAGFKVAEDVNVSEGEAADPESAPILSLTDDGNVFAVYAKDINSNGATIYGRVFDQSGNALGDEFQIGQQGMDRGTGGGHSRNLHVDQLENGDFVVGIAQEFWQGGHQPIFSVVDVTDPANPLTVASDVEVRSQENDSYESAPLIHALEDGGFVTLWSDRVGTDNSSTRNLFGRLWNADGTPRGDQWEFDTTIDGYSGFNVPIVDVTTLDNGTLAVGWARNTSDPDADPADRPVLAIIDPTQNPGDAGFYVLNDTPISASTETGLGAVEGPPVLETLDSGNLVAVWHKGFNSNDAAIYYRIYDQQGNALTDQKVMMAGGDGSGISANNYANWDSIYVTPTGGDNFAVGWMGADLDGDGTSALTNLIEPTLGADLGNEINVISEDVAGNVTTHVEDLSTTDAPTVDSMTNTFDASGVADGSIVSGTAEPNSTVEIRDPDTGEVVGTGVADENGNYEITTAEPLEDGKTYDVVSLDEEGNVSEPAAVTGDLDGPAAPTLTLSNDTGRSDSDANTNDGAVDVTGLEVGTFWEYSTDGGETWNEGQGISFDLPEGEYADGDVIARQTDTFGNVSDTGSLGATIVDTTLPEVVIDEVVHDAESSTITGTTEPNSRVEITDAEGNSLGDAVFADENGEFTFVTDQPVNLEGLSAGVVSDQNPDGSQTAPMVTQLDNGDLLYVWGEGANLSTFGDGHLLRGRLYNADGTPKTDTFDISDFGYNKAAGSGYKNIDGLDVLKMDDGKVAIGWSINRGDASDDIQSKMTVIDTNLAPTDAGFKVAEDVNVSEGVAADPESAPILSLTGDGNVFAVYAKDINSSGATIYGRVFDQSGNALGDEFQIGQNGMDQAIWGGYTRNLYVDQLENGNFVVGIAKEVFDTSGGLAVQHMPIFSVVDVTDPANPLTVASDVEVRSSEENDGYESAPLIHALEDGGFVTLWFDYANLDDSPSRNLLGRLWNADGTPRGDQWEFATPIDGYSGFNTPIVDVTTLDNGTLAIGWNRNTADTNTDVENRPILAIIDPTQSPGDAGFYVLDDTPISASTETGLGAVEGPPVLETLASGNLVAVWREGYYANDEAIYYRIYDQQGNALTDQKVMIAGGDGSGISANNYANWDSIYVTPTGGDNFVVGWMGADLDGDGTSALTNLIEPTLGTGSDYQINVIAEDVAGNVTTHVEDLSVSDAPTVDSMTNTFDASGVADGSIVSGTAEPNSTVEIRDPDTGDVIGTGDADENGNYTITTATPLEDGKDYDVFSVDAEGNDSAPAMVTGDLTAPDAPSLSLANDTGSSAIDEITYDGAVEVVELEVGSLWEYSTDGGETWNEGQGISFDLPEGVYGADDVVVRQTDEAGNVSDTGALGVVTVDTTPPGIEITEVTNQSSSSSIVTGTAEPDSRVEIFDANGDSLGNAVTADANGDFTFTSDRLIKLSAGIVSDQNPDGSQTAPMITQLDNGNLLYVWGEGANLSTLGDGHLLRGRIYDADGNPQTDTFDVSDFGYNKFVGAGYKNVDGLDVLKMDDGKVAIGWSINGSDAADDIQSKMTIIDTSLAPTDAGFKVAEDVNVSEGDAADPESAPILSLTDDGNVFAVYAKDINSAGAEIYGRVFDQSGNALGDEFQIGQNGMDESIWGGYTRNLYVDQLTGGNFVVGIAQEFVQGGHQPIFSVVDITDPTSPVTVASDVEARSQANDGWESAPLIHALEDGGFVTLWFDRANSNDSPTRNLFGRLWNADGTPRGDQWEFDTTIDGYDGFNTPIVDVTTLDNGTLAIGWSRNTADPDTDVLNRPMLAIIDPAQNPGDAGFYVLNDTSMSQSTELGYGAVEGPPVLETLDSGNLVAVWRAGYNSDDAALYYRIYDQQGNALTDQETIVTGGDGAGLSNNNDANWDSIYVTPTGGDDFVVGWMGADHDGDGTSALTNLMTPGYDIAAVAEDVAGNKSVQVEGDVDPSVVGELSGGAPPVEAESAEASSMMFSLSDMDDGAGDGELVLPEFESNNVEEEQVASDSETSGEVPVGDFSEPQNPLSDELDQNTYVA
ncbi:Ig-like domain-containing protein [Halomonas sp. THAF12]|uniref:Ig-like domain-containing protein n=1 Tax=Halomonas sp. B23F22_10 TaxID=3459515 RepID=UPI00373F5EE3